MAHRRTVALTQQRQRHLARTEAGDADGLADLAEPAADLILDLSGRNGDLELALQPLGAGLGYLHCGSLTLSILAPAPRAAPGFSPGAAGAGGGI